MSFRIPFRRVNWITSLFLAGTLLAALIFTPIYIWHHGLDLFQIGLFLFYVTATAMSITLGYHRLFSHLSFKARWPVKLATLIFGACAFENSCLDWCADHRRHHKHVDHDEDPYDISKGFFWAHMGWLIFKISPEHPLDNVNDLMKDKLVMWQHKWVHLIAVLAGFVFPAFLGFLWNGAEGALGAFLIAGIARVVVVQHSTFFINSLCHTIGRQPYSTSHSARDSGVMAFLTFGEGYHNYHHEFQHDYRNGVKPWNYDPTKWAIWVLSKLGLASDLRRVPEAKILLAEMGEARRQAATRMEMEQARLAAEACPMRERATLMLQNLSEKLVENYHELEQAITDKVELSKLKIEQWKSDTRALMEHLSYLRSLNSTASAAA
jgi:stearoyl-CoA desaturase (delta-9 desaturase)